MNSGHPFPALHTQNPLGRFSDRAEDYAKYRPSYPDAAVDLILAGLGAPAELVVADVGAGTGISAQLLAQRGAKVWAIEPNAAMRSAAVAHPGVEFREGTAEQTGLDAQSVKLVVCAQSFHWFNQPVALTEFHRILKSAGRVALMWNDRNLGDEFTRAYTEIVSKAAERDIFGHSDRKSGAALEHSPLFHHFRAYTLAHSYALTLDRLVGLALSASYLPKFGPAYEQLLIDLQTLHQQWTEQTGQEFVELSYQVKLYLSDRAAVADDLSR